MTIKMTKKTKDLIREMIKDGWLIGNIKYAMINNFRVCPIELQKFLKEEGVAND